MWTKSYSDHFEIVTSHSVCYVLILVNFIVLATYGPFDHFFDLKNTYEDFAHPTFIVIFDTNFAKFLLVHSFGKSVMNCALIFSCHRLHIEVVKALLNFFVNEFSRLSLDCDYFCLGFCDIYTIFK